MRLRTPLALAGMLGGGALAVSTGAVTVDLGIGRSIHQLGPLDLDVAAEPETVFDVISGPYLAKTPRAMSEKLRVLDRADAMVVAEHYTPLGSRLRATTVEAVHFERPGRIEFHLLRGPVPHVAETFELGAIETGTRFHYSGELGADLWAVGHLWASVVSRKWVATVAESMAQTKAESERRARVG